MQTAEHQAVSIQQNYQLPTAEMREVQMGLNVSRAFYLNSSPRVRSDFLPMVRNYKQQFYKLLTKA